MFSFALMAALWCDPKRQTALQLFRGRFVATEVFGVDLGYLGYILPSDSKGSKTFKIENTSDIQCIRYTWSLHDPLKMVGQTTQNNGKGHGPIFISDQKETPGRFCNWA